MTCSQRIDAWIQHITQTLDQDLMVIRDGETRVQRQDRMEAMLMALSALAVLRAVRDGGDVDSVQALASVRPEKAAV